MALLDEYEKVLTITKPERRQKEQCVQDFLEENSELLPTPFLQNHKLHFDIIVSKFPLGNTYITDYVYITKSSYEWDIVLVELEDPDKLYFSDKNLTDSDPSHKLHEAINQVLSWQAYIRDHKAEIVNTLKPLLKPVKMREENPINFKYVLIYGRSENRDCSPKRKEMINLLSESNKIQIISYDTIKHIYESQRIHNKKIILSLQQNHYIVKKMDCEPRFFSDITPSELIIPTDDIEKLKSKGYQMDDWLKGKPLSYNGKRTGDEILDALK